MAITYEIRKAFDECTVMAGVENDFECVFATKTAALLYLDEIDAAFRELLEKNAKLRELVADMWNDSVTRMDFAERHAFIAKFVDRMRELEVEA